MPDTKVLAQLQDAVLLHQAGRLDEAEKLYTKVLKADPRNANALNLMGTVATARGRHAEAKRFFEQARQRFLQRRVLQMIKSDLGHS